MILDFENNAGGLHPSLRAIENYDLAAVLEYFDEIENAAKNTAELKTRTGIDFESDTYRSLYKKIKDTSFEIALNGKDISIEPLLTKKELELLRYVIRYQRGVYSINQEVVDLAPGGGDGNADSPGSGVLNDEEVSGQFTLYDNGYYLIEMNSSGGYLQYDDSANDGNGDYIDNCAFLFNPFNRKINNELEDDIPIYKSLTVWVTDDKSSMLTFHEHMTWIMSIDKRYYYGRYEANNSNFFLFTAKGFTTDDNKNKFENIDDDVILDAKQRYAEHIKLLESFKDKTITTINPKTGKEEETVTKLGLANIEIDYDGGFFDFFSLSFDVLSVSNFMKISLNENKLEFYAYYSDPGQADTYMRKLSPLYQKTDLFIGLDGADQKNAEYNIPKFPIKRKINGKEVWNLDGDNLLNTVNKCVSKVSDGDLIQTEYGRSFELMVSAFLWDEAGETRNQWRVRSLARTLNKYPAGNGGHLYAIVKLKTGNSHQFTYKFKEGAVHLFNGENEALSTFNVKIDRGDEYRYNESTDRKMTEIIPNKEKDFTFCIGTENVYDDTFKTKPGEAQFEKVCRVDQPDGIRNAEVKIRKGSSQAFSVYGNGGKGQGIRLNEFGTAYFQNHEDPFIKITYLGNDTIKTTKVLFTKNEGENNGDFTSSVQPGLIYVDDKGVIHSGGFGWAGKDQDDSILVPRYCKVDFELSTLDLRDNIVFKSGNGEEDEIFDNLRISRSFNRYRFSLEDLTAEEYKIGLSVGRDFGFFYDVIGDFDNKEEEFPVNSIGGHPFDANRNSHGYDAQDISDPSKFLSVKANFVLQSYDLNSNLLSMYNNEDHQKQILSVEDEDTFDFIKKKTDLRIKNSKNLRIFRDLTLVTELSINIANSLNLPSILNDEGNPIYKEETERTITKAVYDVSYDGTIVEDKMIVFPFNKQKRFIQGSRVILKFTFNTSRIEIDQAASLFPIGTVFYEKNFNLETSTFVAYDENSTSTFQYVEVLQPNSSFICNVIVKRSLYSFTLKRDLYNILNVQEVDSKDAFEYKEPVILTFKLSDFLRISSNYISQKNGGSTAQDSLDEDGKEEDDEDDVIAPEPIKYGDEKNNSNTYRVFNFEYYDKEIYESFLKLKSKYNEKIYNVSNIDYFQNIGNFKIKSSRIDAFDRCYIHVEKNGNTTTNTEVQDVLDKNSLLPLLVPYKKNISKNIFDETVSIYMSMPKQNVVFRLTSDYLPFKNIIGIDNGAITSIDILKPYNFLITMNSGPTGDGGNGMTPPAEATYGKHGGWGGDGYIPGSGGDGNKTNNWGVGVTKWKGFIPTGLSLDIYLPGCPGCPGAGIDTHAQIGSKGMAAFGRHRTQDGYIFIDDVQLSSKPCWSDGKKNLVPVNCYDSVKVAAAADIRFASFNKAKQNTYLIEAHAGFKGHQGMPGTTKTVNGQNGGGGTPSWIALSFQQDAISASDVTGFNIYMTNDCLEDYYGGANSTQCKGGVKGIFVLGGSIGTARSWDYFVYDGGKKETWSTWNNHHDGRATGLSIHPQTLRPVAGKSFSNGNPESKKVSDNEYFSYQYDDCQKIDLYTTIERTFIPNFSLSNPTGKTVGNLQRFIQQYYRGIFKKRIYVGHRDNEYPGMLFDGNDFPAYAEAFFKNVGCYQYLVEDKPAVGGVNKIGFYYHGQKNELGGSKMNFEEYYKRVRWTQGNSSTSTAGIAVLTTLGEIFRNQTDLKRVSYENIVKIDNINTAINSGLAPSLTTYDKYGMNFNCTFYIKDINEKFSIIGRDVEMNIYKNIIS